MPSKYLERLKEVQEAAKEYTEKETERLENEAAALKDILERRLAGKGLQTNPITDVTKDGYASLQAFLAGKTNTI